MDTCCACSRRAGSGCPRPPVSTSARYGHVERAGRLPRNPCPEDLECAARRLRSPIAGRTERNDGEEDAMTSPRAIAGRGRRTSRRRRSFSSSTGAAPSSSPERPMRSTSATSCSTTSSTRPPPAPASDSRPRPARCATSSRSAGCGPRRRTSQRIPSASTTSRWSSSSAARWPTTSRTSCSIPRCSAWSRTNASTGWACSSRSPTPVWATAAWAPGGVLPRLHGDDAAARHGLRAAVRIRHLPPVHQGRLAAGAAGQLAAPAGPVGSRPPRREGRDQAQLLLRGARRDVAARHRPNRRP